MKVIPRRINLKGGSGKWFDSSKSLKFEEDTRWNGNNHISVATGSQWDHEVLYYTTSGSWILHRWSQWEGSIDSYEKIDKEDALKWLLVNKCQSDDDFDKLPEEIYEAFDVFLDQTEV